MFAVSFKTIRIAGLIGFAVACFGASMAKAQQLPGSKPPAIFDYVRVAGTLSGQAVYCKADQNDIEAYTVRVKARINTDLQNDFDRVSAGLLYKNTKDARSGKAPKMGCKAYLPYFGRIARGTLKEPSLQDIEQ